MERIIVALLAVSILFTALSIIMPSAVERQEVTECLQWKKEAKEYPEYYLTKWQADQCISRGIKVDAPVK